MRFLPIFLITLATAAAQTDSRKLLEQGLKQAVAGLSPVPAADKAAILDATTQLLAKHITLQSDGTATAYQSTSSGRRSFEWRKFVVTTIAHGSLTEADRLNGITKRYVVGLGCEAHRSWDTKTNTWGAWLPTGTVDFPTALSFEWKNGAWTPRESAQLKLFTPGPGESVIQPQRPANDTGLPPGMSRGK